VMSVMVGPTTDEQVPSQKGMLLRNLCWRMSIRFPWGDQFPSGCSSGITYFVYVNERHNAGPVGQGDHLGDVLVVGVPAGGCDAVTPHPSL
jgi:hypothetical protein